MKAVLLLALVTLGATQFSSLPDRIRWHLNSPDHPEVIDHVHSWRLEEHAAHDEHLLLFINDTPGEKYCYVVHISRQWEPLLADEENVHKISEEIYHMVISHTHDTQPLRPGDLAHDYHHWDAATECSGHRTYAVSYTPSFA